ncbi:MAG: sigma-54 dependent transcriptional regulator, partial [Pirellulaceae bacterium]|nr:sigma-54 dependent transcriptional regulator [Pirellulaceae bacterium]
DDEQPARYAMAKALDRQEYQIVEAASGPSAIEMLRQQPADLVFLDLNMPRMGGQVVLEQLGDLVGSIDIVVVTADDSVTSAVQCMRLGAVDYLTKPYEVEAVRGIARRVTRRVELQRRLDELQTQLDQKQAFGALVGISKPMRDLFSQLERAARAPIDILVRGETGTGKELIAREIHRLSDRSNGPFVAVNTAAIAESLAESELFGHVRGAFTGADTERQGVFEQANGGTLFLDEIGDMPLPTQTKILRALQEREIQPVGSAKSIAVDVRVITATHQDLPLAIDDGTFRQDLYYRIRGIELQVPPLRRRREDVILLASYFLERVAKNSSESPQLDSRAVDRLLSHNWPGNVRELEQTITSAAVMAEAGRIRVGDLRLAHAEVDTELGDFSALLNLPLTEAKSQLVENFERKAIERALSHHAGNVSAAARQLGIHRQSLQQKMSQLAIRAERPY